ncbi:MAG: Stk1 family PASTA domain-containing Ser/Thr kinase [Actinomycetota bacterium]
MSTVRPGAVIGDRYELGGVLGSGGMAEVFRAHDRVLDRAVAVKVLSERYAADPAFVERFRREASSAAGLNHPNIVSVYDRGETDGSYYIVMELLPGPDLKRVIREHGPLSPVEAIDYAREILAALAAAHRRDVIHRDIKPQNVMLAGDGHLKVTDFGIARAGDESAMTEAGSVIGTAQYLSPEQARGEEVTAASDCYAVGIVLYEMLTGRVPFDAEKPVAVAMKQINDPPVPPRTLRPDLPDSLNRIVMRALEKRPAQRFRTAEEFAGALLEARHALTGDQSTQVMAAPAEATRTMPTMATAPLAARRPPPPPPAPRRRRGWVPWLVVLLVALAAAGGAAAFLLRDTGPDRVTVPDVTGFPVTAAQRQLTDAGFTTSVQRRAHPTAPVDTVIRTNPANGDQADEGSNIVLVVSSGPALVAVPDVTTKTEEDARLALTREEFDVDVEEEASDTVEEGHVIRQEPAGGAQAAPGATVTITVSTGPEQVEVPNVQLKDVVTAVSEIEQAGLKATTVTKPSTSREPGIVIGQNPPAGSKADPGATVVLTVSEAPAEVEVPSLIGLDVNEAARQLRAAGFTPITSAIDPPNGEAAGVVLDQTPAAHSLAAPGTTVNVIYSTGVTDGGAGTVPAPEP